MRRLRHIFNVFLFILFGSLVLAQTQDELKETAGKLFEKEEYVSATPIYLRLLSLSPKEADVNFRYGTCLLFNSYQKKEALRYLSYAANDASIDPRAFYFYGKALHLNYQFEDAKKYYKLYLQKRTGRDNRYRVEREIEMCDNGKRLLSSFTDIIVSEKQEIENSKFFRLYKNAQTIGGDILVSEDFQSKIDKKKGHIPIVHFPPQAMAIYYSSYGDNEDTGKDIYVRRRLPSGGWGDPQPVPGGINSSEDEDFPYMHPSGDFLYFSSKGHNSMGGYDVFFSRFNPDLNAFGAPENVDFAISSPDDDLFYVVDSLYQNAYFASARQSQNGKLHVYRVKVARVPIQEVIVMGDFLSEVNPENKKMNVVVKSHSSGDEIGKIQSNEKGKYSFVFPKGGKYDYEITVAGSDDVFKFLIEIPFLDEFRPLKQKALETKSENGDIVKIVNLFDERVDGAEALIAEVIRKKAELEVNIDNFDLKEIESQQKRNDLLAELGFKNMSIPEIKNQIEELAINEKINIEKVEQIESNVNAEIIEKSLALEANEELIEGVNEKIEATSGLKEKHALLLEAKYLENEKQVLALEIENLGKLKKEALSGIGEKSPSGIGKIEFIENQFKALLNSDKEAEAYDLLAKNKNSINAARNNSPNALIQKLIDNSTAIKAQIDKLKVERKDYEAIEDNLASQIILLKNSLSAAKNKDIERIEKDIKNKEEELVMVRDQLKKNSDSIDAKNQELYIVDSNIASLQKAMLSDAVAEVNKESVEQSIAKAAAAITEVESSSIDNQILEIESTMPELNPDYNPEIAVSSNSMLPKFEEKNEASQGEIEANTSLSEPEKLNLLIENNNSTIEEVDNRLNDLEKDIASNSTPALLQEQKDLEGYKEKLNTENSQYFERQEVLNQNDVTASVTAEEVINDLNPKYEEEKKAIQNNTNLSEKEKLIALQEKDEAFVKDVIEEIEKNEKGLKKNPEDKQLQERKNILQQIKEQKQDEMAERTQTIDAIADVATDIVAEVDADVVKKEINEEVRKGYEEKKSAIINSDEPEFRKEKSIAALEADQLKALTEKQNEITKELKRNPDDAMLKAKSESIASLIDEQKTVLENQLSKVKGSVSIEAVNEVVTRLDQKYASDIEALKKSELTAAQNDIAEREVVLQDEIEGEIKAKDKALQKNYSVTAEIEKAILEKALEESKAREREARSGSAIADTNTGRNDFIADLREEAFGGGENSLEATYTDKDQLSMQDQILAFYESQLNERIGDATNQLNSDPSNEDLKKNLTWLQEESEAVKDKRKSIGISIGELETNLTSDNGNPETNDSNIEDEKNYINELHSEAFGDGINPVEVTYQTKDELTNQEQLLAAYELELEKKITLNAKKLKKDDSNKELKDIQEWLSKELTVVKEKRRTIGISLGDLETEVVSVNANLEGSDQIINELEAEELALKTKLDDPELTSGERKTLENELEAVVTQKVTRENQIVTEEIAIGQQENKTLVAQLEKVSSSDEQNEVLSKAGDVNSSKAEEIAQLVKEAGEAKTVQEQNFLLNQAQEDQEKINETIKEVITDNLRTDLEAKENVSLLTKEDLEKKRRAFTVQIGELTSEIVITEKEIARAKKKEIANLETKKLKLETEKSLLESQLRTVEERLLKMHEDVPVVDEVAMNTAITFNEERQAAGTEEYENYYTLAIQALETEQQIINLEQELKNEQSQVNDLLSSNDQEANGIEIQIHVQKIRELQANIDKLRIELVQEKYNADQALPSNSDIAMKMQNLVARGIKPIKTTAVALALLQMPSNGLAVNPNAESHYSAENPIPVDVESPSGLVYRVQIGAFAKPIPQDLFKEFNPVSGEKINGTNITRYMAGFFNNSAAVTSAREQIKGLGYTDAFIIAYCDGKRIGFGEARKREAEGTCVPKGENELMLEVAEKIAENLGLPTTNEVQEVPEMTYNQAPGASEADPIELKKGLFFTIQVGVFNRPVGSESVYFMKELITIRLPNGQIRYSSGVFNSIEEALPRREEALQRGVKGAFVTAYYQGERITLAEAKKLLSEKGPSILQSEIEKEEIAEVVKTPTNVIRTDTVTSVNISPVRVEESTDYIQIVTKKSFDEFPRDVLNRYNAEGNFFFDAKDNRVKSVIYKNRDDLPRLWNFREDIDTLYIPIDEVNDTLVKIISVRFTDSIIPGDFMDWLLRFNRRREFNSDEDGIELRIFTTEPNDVELVQREVAKFSLQAIIVEENELELQLEENE